MVITAKDNKKIKEIRKLEQKNIEIKLKCLLLKENI